MSVVSWIDHCELCGEALYLVERSGSVCIGCIEKLKTDKRNWYYQFTPCSYCGRTHTYQFLCSWCIEWVCDGCSNREHADSGDCHYPEEWDA